MNSNPSLESPNTVLPRQVRRQMERLQELQDAQRGTDTAVADPPPAEQAAPAEPAATSPAPGAPEQLPADPRHVDWRYWKKRFEVTEGMLQAVREERRAERQTASDRVRALEQQVAELQAQQPQAAVDPSTMFTAEQIELLGKEETAAIATAATRRAAELARAEVDKQLKPLRERQEQDQQDASQRRVQAYIDALTRDVPNWREINETDGWKLWLAELDEATGTVRDDIVAAADKRLTPAPVVKLLRQYEQTLNPSPVPQTPQVMPSGGNAAGTPGNNPAPAPQRYPSPAEVKKFYTDKALGRYNSRQGEAAEYEARIKAAREAGYLR